MRRGNLRRRMGESIEEDVSLILDARGTILAWNRGATNLYGYTEKQVIGRRKSDVLKTQYPLPENQINDLLSHGECWNGLVTERKQSGEKVTVRCHRESLFLMGKSVVLENARVFENNEDLLSFLQLQANLLQSSKDAIYLWTLENGIFSWNTGACEIYGYDEFETLGKLPRDLLRSELPMSRAELFDTVDQAGHWSGQVTRYTKDGRRRYISALIHQAVDNNRVVYIAIERDITSGFMARQRQKAQELMLNASHDAMIIWSESDGIVQWNQGAGHVYGYRAAEVMGQTPNALIQSTPDFNDKKILQILRDRGEWKGEQHVVAGDGRRVVVQSHFQTSMINNQWMILGISRDVTDQMMMRDRLEQLEHIIKLSDDVIQIIDSSGRVYLWNQGAERTTGYSAQEIQHTDLESLADMCPGLTDELWIQLQEQGSARYRSCVYSKWGEEIIYDNRAQLMCTDNHHPRALVISRECTPQEHSVNDQYEWYLEDNTRSLH